MKMIITAFVNKETRDIFKLTGSVSDENGPYYVSFTIPGAHIVINLRHAMNDPALQIKSVKFIK